jgi:hypothetical protein
MIITRVPAPDECAGPLGAWTGAAVALTVHFLDALAAWRPCRRVWAPTSFSPESSAKMRRLNKVNLIDEAHVLLFYMMLLQKLKVYWVL